MQRKWKLMNGKAKLSDEALKDMRKIFLTAFEFSYHNLSEEHFVQWLEFFKRKASEIGYPKSELQSWINEGYRREMNKPVDAND
jgi:truncated hemoglobin YjbI